jgi:hypothetical protein
MTSVVCRVVGVGLSPLIMSAAVTRASLVETAGYGPAVMAKARDVPRQ